MMLQHQMYLLTKRLQCFSKPPVLVFSIHLRILHSDRHLNQGWFVFPSSFHQKYDLFTCLDSHLPSHYYFLKQHLESFKILGIIQIKHVCFGCVCVCVCCQLCKPNFSGTSLRGVSGCKESVTTQETLLVIYSTKRRLTFSLANKEMRDHR